ncbi:substrate-binding domain-containing protein [Brenneria populi subsp. brevivirga]|uniref:substrate-binding domain-containing protein n=1 Tax=Brenneria populi TaxID=1505588 RepID=UPI002E170D31|nr:substrate-binding domain-containing protein [Brenneria populi subsp. brevivirga]
MKMQFKLKALAAAGMMMMAGAASAAVVGGGATLPEDLYNGDSGNDGILTKATPGFNTYIGVGSGNGKSAFFNNDATKFSLAAGTTVDYAGSDSLVSATEAQNYKTNSESAFGPLIQVPSVLTSVTVPFNVSGLSALNLTSEKLALIFADPSVLKWNDTKLGIPNAPNADIKVVYRAEESGTTEIFLRHLNAVDSGLVSSVNKDFAKAINVASSSKYIAATGSDGVVSAVNNNAYSIGYVSPDKVEYGNPAKVVAITRTVNGQQQNLLPTEVNVQAVLNTVTLPSTATDKADPLKWGISNANPSEGYPIVASTNLIFSQCYQNADDAEKILSFFEQHYGSTDNDAAIKAHGFVSLRNDWKQAIFDTFWDAGSDLSIGNPNVCNGIGRPQ